MTNYRNTSRLRVAVVGSGIGREHLAAYHALPDRFEIAAVCDIDRGRGAALADQFGAPRVVGSLDELCRMAELDVIDICTPASLHVEHALQVLAAGKHVVCEKPIAGALAGIDCLIEAEAAAGRRVMPIFNYRFGSGVLKLRRLIAAGVTGRAYLGTIEVAWRRRAAYYDVPWRGHWATELGGCLTGHAIHFLDLLTYVLGPVANVFARTATLVNPIEVEDCASLALLMADGGLAAVSVTLGSSAEISRQRYCFANLVAESNLAPYAKNTDDAPDGRWQFTADTPEARAAMDAALAGIETGDEGFKGQFARYADALEAGTELPVTLADARRTAELLTAAYYSARTGAAVALPIGREHPLYHGWQP